jgi:MinD superfamily P-loop ATPase
MAQYTIELTQTEDMALAYASLSQQDWIDNVVKNRCRIAIDEIVKIAVEQAMETNVQLPTTKDAVVAMAFEQSWVKTIAQSNAE